MALARKNEAFASFLQDVAVHSYCPGWSKNLPVLSTALLHALWYVALHYLGLVMGGMVGFLPVVMLTERLSQPSIVGAASRKTCGTAWGIITVIYAHHWLRMWPFMSLLCNCAAVLIEAIIACCLALTMRTAPLGLVR